MDISISVHKTAPILEVFSRKLHHLGSFTRRPTTVRTLLRLKCAEIIVYQHFKLNIPICSISPIQWYAVYLHYHYFDTYQWGLRSEYTQFPLENKWVYGVYPPTTLMDSDEERMRLAGRQDIESKRKKG